MEVICGYANFVPTRILRLVVPAKSHTGVTRLLSESTRWALLIPDVLGMTPADQGPLPELTMRSSITLALAIIFAVGCATPSDKIATQPRADNSQNAPTGLLGASTMGEIEQGRWCHEYPGELKCGR